MTEDVFEAVHDHAAKHKGEVELGQTDSGKWRVTVVCQEPGYSGSGMGASPKAAYTHLANKLGLEKEAA